MRKNSKNYAIESSQILNQLTSFPINLQANQQTHTHTLKNRKPNNQRQQSALHNFQSLLSSCQTILNLLFSFVNRLPMFANFNLAFLYVLATILCSQSPLSSSQELFEHHTGSVQPPSSSELYQRASSNSYLRFISAALKSARVGLRSRAHSEYVRGASLRPITK